MSPPTNPVRFKLHPAFVDTTIGESLIRADTLVWPALNAADVNARGDAFVLAPLSPAARYLTELRASYRGGGRISNINDVESPATFAIADGQVRVSGLPRFEILGQQANGSVGIASGTSDLLTRYQGLLFTIFDASAYDTLIQVYRTVGLLRYVRAADPMGWRQFAASVPRPSRRTRTPSIMCAGCSSEVLFAWLAHCSALAER